MGASKHTFSSEQVSTPSGRVGEAAGMLVWHQQRPWSSVWEPTSSTWEELLEGRCYLDQNSLTCSQVLKPNRQQINGLQQLKNGTSPGYRDKVLSIFSAAGHCEAVCSCTAAAVIFIVLLMCTLLMCALPRYLSRQVHILLLCCSAIWSLSLSIFTIFCSLSAECKNWIPMLMKSYWIF